MNHLDILEPYVQNKDKEQEWYKSNNYYSNYYDLSLFYKPKSILEFGVRYGYSALCMIKGSLDSGNTSISFLGIDNEDEENSNTIASNNLDKFSTLNNCKIDYEIMNKQILELNKDTFKTLHYDLIHLDANHSYKVLHEIQILWSALKNEGIMIIDDMGSYESWTDWIRTKRNYIDNFLQRYISFNQIDYINYSNTYRGTYIIKKSKNASSHGEIT